MSRSPVKQSYYQKAEAAYIRLLERLVARGQTDLDVVSLIQVRVSGLEPESCQIRQDLLKAQEESRITNDKAKEIELAVCRSLIAYYQEVKFVQSLQIWVVEQRLLADKRKQSRFSTTIEAIEAHLLDSQSYLDKLNQYDAALREAILEDGIPIRSLTAWELQRLQSLLGIATQHTIPPEALRSEFGIDYIDYIPLWRRLEAKQWQQANQETKRLMLKIAGIQQIQQLKQTKEWQQANRGKRQSMLDQAGSTGLSNLQDFPCVDLFTIDYLWLHFSNGYFGFSVQQQLWRWLDHNFEKFVQQVGWLDQNGNLISNSQLKFQPNVERGHLPFLLPIFDSAPQHNRRTWQAEFISELLQKLESCPIPLTAK